MCLFPMILPDFLLPESGLRNWSGYKGLKNYCIFYIDLIFVLNRSVRRNPRVGSFKPGTSFGTGMHKDRLID